MSEPGQPFDWHSRRERPGRTLPSGSFAFKAHCSRRVILLGRHAVTESADGVDGQEEPRRFVLQAKTDLSNLRRPSPVLARFDRNPTGRGIRTTRDSEAHRT